jgi:Arc/MetJ family transcription regulator
MRTTVNLDDDVAAAVERLRRTRHLGLSEAVNELARAGLRSPVPETGFRQRTVSLGVGVDVRDIGDALEIAEGPEHR